MENPLYNEIIFWISFILIVYTYFGYYFLLILLAKLKTKTRKEDTNYHPTVSMLIAAYNEENVIGEKIQNCLKLDYPKEKMTFLFGSDGSDDNTNTILKQSENDYIKPYFFQKHRGKVKVLNELVQLAQGDILVFSDANTIYEPGSIRNLIKYFVDPIIGGVCGKLELFLPSEDLSGIGEKLYWNYENRLKCLEGKIKTVFGANGAIYAIRKNLYSKLPENKMINDDFYIPLKVVEKRYDVIYEEKAKGREPTSFDSKGEFSRKVRIGAGNFNILREIRSLLNPLRGFVAFGLWSHKIIRWFVPFLLISLFTSHLLISRIPFYFYLLIFHLLFYMTVFIGWLSSKRSKKSNVFTYMYYFVLINFALLVGFFKSIFGIQESSWTHVDR